MAKVLSKSGDSLADVYDVEGSIAGIERLQSEEVHLTHDMGQTLFSERLASRMLELSSGVLSQSTVFNVNFSIGITSRLLAIQVLSTNSGRLVKCSVAITSPPAVDNMDVPIWSRRRQPRASPDAHQRAPLRHGGCHGGPEPRQRAPSTPAAIRERLTPPCQHHIAPG